MASETFINENGREILVEVDSGGDSDVRVLVRGPHSEIESLLTEQEAMCVYRLLGAHFSAKEQPDAS